MADRPAAESPEVGRSILRWSVAGTAVFSLGAVLAVIAEGAAVGVFVALSLLQFLIGTIVFLVAFARAVGRSRTESIGIGGLYFASGCAPRRVQVVLLTSLAVQVTVSVVAASVRLYTPVAFGVLAPMWSLGLTGLWSACHGTFAPRESEPVRQPREQRTGGEGRETKGRG